MQILDAQPLLATRDRPWFDIARLNVGRDEAHAWLGSAPFVDFVDGVGDADYWAFQFDCGLIVGFEFVHAFDFANVFATEPSGQHVVRHLGQWRDRLVTYAPKAFERDRNAMIELFASSMPELHQRNSFQLWRQGDDGNPVPVGYPTSELDAQCWQDELESHFHKQIYWVSRINPQS